MNVPQSESGPSGRSPVVLQKLFEELTGQELHNIFELRSRVFVVEQSCVYADIDGRDNEPATIHLWCETADQSIAAYARLLDEGPDMSRIGRVVTDPASRGSGLAGLIVRTLCDQHGGTLVLDAQAHLADWYQTFGFLASGPEFMEDGIPHVPMRRDSSHTPE